jgi:hypothetical protein
MPRYRVPCQWIMSGHYEIEASSEAEALGIAENLPLPDHLSESFETFPDEVETPVRQHGR